VKVVNNNNIEDVALNIDRLKELRKKRNYSVLSFAKTLGVARSTYAGYESGYRSPDLKKLKRIAELLDTSIDYLQNLTDDETSSNKKLYNDVYQLLMSIENPTWKGEPISKEKMEMIAPLLIETIEGNKPQ
jgi:transcriptional regulator with XRE-family HTH domain